MGSGLHLHEIFKIKNIKFWISTIIYTRKNKTLAACLPTTVVTVKKLNDFNFSIIKQMVFLSYF